MLKGTGTGAATGTAAGSMISPGLGTIIGAGIGVLGGITGSWLSGKKAKKAAKQANELAIWQQLQNQKWQEYMSNTAHQREVKDLKEAGLNPVLSANNGASVGGGGIGNTPAYESADYSNTAKTAMEGLEKALAIKGMENQTKSTEADATLKGKQTELTTTQNQLTDIQKQNAAIENQILNDTKDIIIDTTKATKAAEKTEAEARQGTAQIELENQSNPLWRGLKGFSDVATLMLGPLGAMVNMAGTAKKAAALGQFAKNGEREANTNALKLNQPKLKKERYYDKNGKYGLKEYEYE